MEPADTPPMSGSNSICVATVLLETGILPMREPETEITLEAPGGLIRVRADCRDGRVERVRVVNLPSFAGTLGTALEVEGLGTLSVDTAFGGDSFVVVDAGALDITFDPSEARDLANIGTKVADAATDQLGFDHPTLPDWRHISFCLFAGPVTRDGDTLRARSAVAIRPGKIDRSPTGTAVSARMALLRARGVMEASDTFTATSLINSAFQGRIVGEAMVGDRAAILPEITGRAWITGTHQHMLDPTDPWPGGYRLSDTWPLRD